jgi:hypothetical protein
LVQWVERVCGKETTDVWPVTLYTKELAHNKSFRSNKNISDSSEIVYGNSNKCNDTPYSAAVTDTNNKCNDTPYSAAVTDTNADSMDT